MPTPVNHGSGRLVLSVNYGLAVGYGLAFHHPEHAGFAGAAEYQDVVAGARFRTCATSWGTHRCLGHHTAGISPWCSARNSDIFKAGVDLHGVHDWSRLMERFGAPGPTSRKVITTRPWRLRGRSSPIPRSTAGNRLS